MIDAGRELTGARYAALGVLDDRRELLARFLTSGIDEDTRRVIGDLPRGHGVLGELIRDARPLRLTDVGAHPRSYGFPIGHPPMDTFLGVPIVVAGEAWGNLYLTEKSDGEFTDDDEQIVMMLARYAAIAIGNARHVQALSERRDELERTVRRDDGHCRDLTGAGGRDRPRCRAPADRQARTRAGRRRAPWSSSSRSATACGSPPWPGMSIARSSGRELPMESTVAGRVMRTRQSQRLSDELNRARFDETGLGRFGFEAGAGLFVPLAFRTETPGVLAALHPPGAGEFSEEDERLLTSFATSAASRRRHRPLGGHRPSARARGRDRGRTPPLGARAARRNLAGPRCAAAVTVRRPQGKRRRRVACGARRRGHGPRHGDREPPRHHLRRAARRARRARRPARRWRRWPTASAAAGSMSC